MRLAEGRADVLDWRADGRLVDGGVWAAFESAAAWLMRKMLLVPRSRCAEYGELRRRLRQQAAQVEHDAGSDQHGNGHGPQPTFVAADEVALRLATQASVSFDGFAYSLRQHH